jgi:hypothetical protein
MILLTEKSCSHRNFPTKLMERWRDGKLKVKIEKWEAGNGQRGMRKNAA